MLREIAEKLFLMNNAGLARLNSVQLQFSLLKHERERNGAKGSRRGKLDIIAEVLAYCEQPKTKTSIMYNTNLNYAQLKVHMDTLLAQGLLVKDVNKYVVTEKGFRFLELFFQLNDLLESLPVFRVYLFMSIMPRNLWVY